VAADDGRKVVEGEELSDQLGPEDDRAVPGLVVDGLFRQHPALVVDGVRPNEVAEGGTLDGDLHLAGEAVDLGYLRGRGRTSSILSEIPPWTQKYEWLMTQAMGRRSKASIISS
jgi:hypothetical protein